MKIYKFQGFILGYFLLYLFLMNQSYAIADNDNIEDRFGPEEKAVIEELKEMYKWDRTQRIISPVTTEETVRTVYLLLDALKINDLEAKGLFLYHLRRLIDQKQMENKLLKQVIAPPVSQIAKVENVNLAREAMNILWLIEYKTAVSNQARLDMLWENMNALSKPSDERVGYNWREVLHQFLQMGGEGAAKLLRMKLNEKYSKLESPSGFPVAELEISIDWIMEKEKLKRLDDKSRVQELANKIVEYSKYDKPFDGNSEQKFIYPQVQKEIVYDCIRRLSDESETFGDKTLYSLWNGDDYIIDKWIIEDILLDRGTITPTMKKLTRPIS